MIVSNCPRCGEALRVPTDALPDDAYARCPWCRDTFPVADVLKVLPPVLELLSADGKPLAAARHLAAAVGVAGLSDTSANAGFGSIAVEPDAGFQIDPAESSDLESGKLTVGSASTAETIVDHDTLEGFDFGKPETQGELASDDQLVGFEVEDSDDTWGGDQTSLMNEDLAPMKVSPRPIRKSQGSGIGTAIKVVLGGLLAVPIAGGLLMAMGRNPDWGFWPFNGSGESNRNVVAAPPADLSASRPQARAIQDQPTGRMLNPDLGNDALSVASDPVESARDQLLAEPKVEDLAPLAESDPPLTDSTQADPSILLPNGSDLAMSEPNLADITAPEEPVESIDPTSDPPSLEMPAISADEAPNPRSEKPPVETPFKETETAKAIPAVEPATAEDPAELVEVADRAGKMVEALATYDGDPKERVRRMLLTYEKIAVACNLASPNSKALNKLATKIKNSPLLDEIGGAASEWLVYSARKSEGIVLVGQSSANGQGKMITLDSGTELSVVGDTQLPAVERVLAMGRIIDENSVELVLAEPLP